MMDFQENLLRMSDNCGANRPIRTGKAEKTQTHLHRMSWQSYIDTMKTPDQSGAVPVAEAAICGIGAGQESVWVSTPGLQGITVDEIKKLGSKDRSSFAQNGVHIAGTRCRLIRDQMDQEPVFALDLKTAADADGNTFGVCVGKTKTAVVIAKGTKEASGGQISNKVFNVVEHLRKAGM